MFKCQLCGLCSKAGQKATKIVPETRRRKYTNRFGMATEGYEIVKEAMIACPDGNVQKCLEEVKRREQYREQKRNKKRQRALRRAT